jgi:uncharacterized iron-regulated protein
LAIGRHGKAQIEPGQLFDLSSTKSVTMDDLVAAAKGKPFVFLGEEHATPAHQQMEADVIRALAASGRHVIVGMEMFTRPKQDVLDQWSAGALTESDFLDQVDWKGQWGYPYACYRPVLEAVKALHLPLVALNVPRAWPHAVSLHGIQGLPTSARLQLPPEIFLGNADHRRIFDAMVGPHGMPGVSPDNIYAAQVLWDESMADTALRYLALTQPPSDTVFVTISGSGHVLYGQGLNWRIARRKGGRGVTVVMMQSATPVTVSRGIGDFVYLTAPTATSP